MDTLAHRTAPILLIEAPPRHGKSLLVSQWLPAWFLGNWPDKRVILGAHEAGYARYWGRRVRDTLTEFGEQSFAVKVSDSQSAASDWETNYGGGMFTAGVGGSFTGRGADLIIIDDPLKGAEQAFSETIRDKQWDWWHGTVWPRREPGAVAVIVMTRWHTDDIAGRLLELAEDERQPVRRIRLPAIAENDDPMGRAEGEPLWPQRWPLAELEKIERAKPLNWWLAQYQQRPTREGRAEWPDEYFTDILTDDWPDKFEIEAIAVDPSKGRSDKSDFCAIVHVGLSRGKLWVDADLGRWPAEEIVERCVTTWHQHPAAAFGVESDANQDLFGPLVAGYCRERRITPLPFTELSTEGIPKPVRIRRLGPHLRAKIVRVRDNPGGRLLVRQLKEFPLGQHDDGPDALDGAIRLLNILSLGYAEPERDELVTV